eukprot:g7139.t1
MAGFKDGWDLNEMLAIDETLAATPKVQHSAAHGKRAGRRGSLMSKIEDDIAQGGGRTKERAAQRRQNRRTSLSYTDETDGGAVKVNVYLLDGSTHILHVLPDTKVRHALITIKDKLKLVNDADFAFFKVTNGLTTGDLQLVEETERLLKLTSQWTAEQADPRLLESGDVKGTIPGGTRHIVFKRRLYLPWSPVIEEIKSAKSVTDGAHMLEYIESVYNVMHARYPCNKNQLMELASLMLQAELGDFNKGEYEGAASLANKMDCLLPAYFRLGRKMVKYADRVVRVWKKKAGLSPLLAQQELMKVLREWFPFYGAEFFPANYKRMAKSGETRGEMITGVYFAVSHRGVFVLYRTEGKMAKQQPFGLLVKHRYNVMKSWAVSESKMVFSFVLGKKDQCFVVTPSAPQINQLFEDYMREFHEVTQGSMQILGEMSNEELKASSPIIRSRSYGDRASSPVGDAGDDLPELPADPETPTNGTVPDGWVKLHDETTGEKYYFSSKRRLSVWSINEVKDLEHGMQENQDESAAPSDDWAPVADPASGHTYYVNQNTGETSWKMGGSPQTAENEISASNVGLGVTDFKVTEVAEEYYSSEEEADGDEPESLNGWVPVQSASGTYYVNNETGESSWETPTETSENKGEEEQEPAAAEWAAEWDETSQRYYYVNPETGVSQWEPPESWAQGEGAGESQPVMKRKSSGRRKSLFDEKIKAIQNQDNSDFLEGF